jgi:hypothetical protein
MLARSSVPIYEKLKLVKLIGNPRNVIVRMLKNESKMLGNTGLVDIFPLFEKRDLIVSVNENGHVTVILRMLQKVEDATLFTLKIFRLTYAVIVI